MTGHVKVFLVGDIVGKPGRLALRSLLPGIVSNNQIDFVIANGENAAGGIGITPDTAAKMFSSGVDVITTGNHIWKHKSILDYLDSEERILRPANYPDQAPGKGWRIYKTAGGIDISVINLNGRVFMESLNCPFAEAQKAIQNIGSKVPVRIIDFHAEATSEKQAMGWHLDGRASLVGGTHTHVQTADERILPEGTGFITDIGMTGPMDSVIGMQREHALSKFLHAMPRPMKPAKNNIQLHGIIVKIDPRTGKCVDIERVSRKLLTPQDDDSALNNP